ncbi:hypothetical protein D918_01048, partial [Trichuris suis]
AKEFVKQPLKQSHWVFLTVEELFKEKHISLTDIMTVGTDRWYTTGNRKLLCQLFSNEIWNVESSAIQGNSSREHCRLACWSILLCGRCRDGTTQTVNRTAKQRRVKTRVQQRMSAVFVAATTYSVMDICGKSFHHFSIRAFSLTRIAG